MGAWHLKLAARVLSRGGIVACPTEAVFGLSCDPLNPEAVARLAQLKRRPADKGFILIGAELDQFQSLIADLDSAAIDRMQASWPGPVTWVVPSRQEVPRWLTGGRSTLAIRVPGHPVAQALCRLAGPLISTSANRSARQPATTALRVRLAVGADIDLVIPGQVGERRAPSELRDLVSGKILRPG